MDFGSYLPSSKGLRAPDVEHIRYDIAEDWSGDWAIFFRIVVSDEVSGSDKRLRDIATKVAAHLADRLDFAAMGLLPYYNFRSVSEQAVLREEAWA